MTKNAWWLVVLCAMAAGCGGDDPGRDVDAGQSAVERGRYLVNNVGLCSFCHTPLLPDGTRDPAKLFAGNPCFIDVVPENPDVGCLPSRNLTPDETGLKSRSNDEIKMAIRDGRRTDGQNLTPVMPYWVFHNMTDGDLDAIVAYLRTLKAVPNQIPPRQPPWDMVPATSPPLDAAMIPTPRADYPEKARAERGRYLVGMAGLCIDCHTSSFDPPDPRAFTEVIDRSKMFQGNRPFPAEALGLPSPPYPAIIMTANLTPDPETGIGSYTVQDFVTLFRTGKDRNGKYVCAATHGGPTSAYAALTNTDIEDIAHYLLSIPAMKTAKNDTCDGIQ